MLVTLGDLRAIEHYVHIACSQHRVVLAMDPYDLIAQGLITHTAGRAASQSRVGASMRGYTVGGRVLDGRGLTTGTVWKLRGDDGDGVDIRRCLWDEASGSERAYHDEEWGVPLRDGRGLFELLCLEGMLVGAELADRARQARGIPPGLPRFRRRPRGRHDR